MHIDPRDLLICAGGDHGWPAAQDERDVATPGELGPRPASTPIHQTSLFTFPGFDALLDGFASEHRTNLYSRGRNPTVQALERRLAALERGKACLCFSSGMAAVSAVFLGLLEAGDHVLFVNDTYGPSLQLAAYLHRFQIEHD